MPGDPNRPIQSNISRNKLHMRHIKPGATIGILGGGQLGRMLAMAAARLGLQCHVFTPEPDACALQVVPRRTVASFSDKAALRRFASDCDVITYEFENVPAETAALLASRKPLFPDPRVLKTTQDRLIEKNFLQALGIATAPFAPVETAAELNQAIDSMGLPAILKTRRFGYDGKGQALIRNRKDVAPAWQRLGGRPCLLEGFVKFEREISVIVARGRDGKAICFDVTENKHRHHILQMSLVPARIPQQIDAKARRIAFRIADAFDYVGVLAVEMFVVRNARGRTLLVNEIAPRVHNSGHWTIDGASASQFEQHIRAVAGWPLSKPIRHGTIRMENLIGLEPDTSSKRLAAPGTALHLYGKVAARPGRKMGHVTTIVRVAR